MPMKVPMKSLKYNFALSVLWKLIFMVWPVAYVEESRVKVS